MNYNIKRCWSLKSKLIIFTSVVFLISIWSLALFASRMLNEEMEQITAKQQFSTASFMAEAINEALETRLKSLEKIASEISPALLTNTVALQELLEQRPLLQILFNSGVFATGTDGTAIADVPLSAGRIGVNYMDRSSISVPIKEGKSIIGRPAMGKKLGAPIFSISVPIRDNQGKAIGVLAGTINLNKPSFLDELTNNHYGKTGGYLLVAPQHRLIVTATDKRLVMAPVSPPGTDKLIDRFIQGYEGSGILVNPVGVEVLASAKRIPVAGWYVAASLPTAEAFAPIHTLKNRFILFSLFLTLIACGFIFWMLKRLLSPMVATVAAISAMTASNQQLQPLAIARNDELGTLIGAFNHLLESLALRDEELRESEERFRVAQELSPDGFIIFHPERDANGKVVDFTWVYENAATARMNGADPKEIIGRRLLETFPLNEGTNFMAAYRQVAETGKSAIVEDSYQGETIVSRTWFRTAVVRTGEDIAVLVQDITARKQAEAALRESKERLVAVMDNLCEGIIMADDQGRVIYWNPAALAMFGYASMDDCQLKLAEFADTFEVRLLSEDRSLPVEDWPMSRVLRGEVLHDWEVRLRRLDQGWEKIISYSGWLICSISGERFVFVSTSDITDRRRAEEERQQLDMQLHHAQKMESLGVLSGGIAHDFNNILAIIIGYCALTKMDYETAENNITEIEKASERAAGLCRQMLDYAGKAQLTKTQVNMWMLVDEMVTMLKSTLPQNALIKPDLSAKIPIISGDASQLRQIVMNLIINASEAIGKEHGEIQVSLTKTTVIAGQSDKDHKGISIPPGKYVCLEVTDNGCGMDEATKWRIFEPFYTTKFTGRGLGMSAVLGIINSHGGALQLFSQLGQGTTFKVYLPVQIGDSSRDENPKLSDPSAPWQGSGTILLVEDEEQVRLIAKILLKKFGFTVLEAVNGEEALKLYSENAADITLVVTDMGMPVMDGYELFIELKKMNPQLPIIISSGFGDAEVGSRIASDDIAGLISKPYNPDKLREVLKSVLKDSQ